MADEVSQSAHVRNVAKTRASIPSNAKRLLVHMGDRHNSALPTAGLAVQCHVLLYQTRNSSRAQSQFTGDQPDRSAATAQTFELGHRTGVMLCTWATNDPSLGLGTLYAGDGELAWTDAFLAVDGLAGYRSLLL
jgi:hypothetical protein